ncbi:MAG: hypothetical protein UV54_C0028G0010 [Candidatus Beckwithbacteria bacterium GW2011_GWA2_43_10]|uniref:Uncharacterized protein n=1 Tax=Candidatus Beckwithbacteria bacterium GW2011_GWA2_43_10 TaxID=1618369 RepID=A0A0G1C2J9_9BACT|nr:MAG: hypothetical protein UV54_C0028G0010 [Candidatus Beckwithbacteria bacterium GW2011_GWA2_43_10]
MSANKEVPNRIFLSFLALFPSISPNSDNIGNINGFLLSKVASPDPLEFFLSHPPSHPNFPPLTLSEPGPGHRSPDLLFYFWHQYLDPLTPGSNPEVNAELARLMQLPANHIGRSELALTYLQEMKEKGIPLSTREQIAVFITIGSSVAITPEGQLIHLSNDLTPVPITLDELAAIVQEKVSRTIGQIGVGAWNQTIEALGQLTENSGAIVNGLLTRLYLEEDPFCDGDGESPPNTTPSAPIFLPILETAPAHALPLQPDLATPTPYPTLEPDIIFKETMTALLEKLQSPKEQMLEISMSVDSHRKQIETQIAGAFSFATVTTEPGMLAGELTPMTSIGGGQYSTKNIIAAVMANCIKYSGPESQPCTVSDLYEKNGRFFYLIIQPGPQLAEQWAEATQEYLEENPDSLLPAVSAETNQELTLEEIEASLQNAPLPIIFSNGPGLYEAVETGVENTIKIIVYYIVFKNAWRIFEKTIISSDPLEGLIIAIFDLIAPMPKVP